jgi:hypothetical protein
MRLLLLFSLALLLVPQDNAPNQQKAQKQVSTKKVQPPETAQQSSDPGVSPVVKFYTYNAQQENNTEGAKIIFDGLLVILTGALVWVGWRQAKILDRQADILHKHEEWMQKHDANLVKLSDAAKDSANAALLGGRAWVTFMVPDKPINQRLKNGQPDGAQVLGFIKNVGATPAMIIKKFHFLNIVKRGESLDSAPPYLQVNESQTKYQMIPQAAEPAIVGLSKSDLADVEAGNSQLRVLGQIVYEDVFGRFHETRYCFRYYPEDTVDRLRGLYPEGPDAYLKVS